MSLNKFFPVSAVLVLEDKCVDGFSGYGNGHGSGISNTMSNNTNSAVNHKKGGDVCNNRIYSKYYQNDPLFTEESKKQDFEASIMKRISKCDSEFLHHQDRLVLFRRSYDVVVMIVGRVEENEMLLHQIFECIDLVLRETIKPQLDSTALLDNYDLLVVALDQCVMEGIPLDFDASDIIARVVEDKGSFRSSSVSSFLGGSSTTKLNSSLHSSPIADAASQGLSSAFSFAKNTMKSFLSK